MRRIVDPYAVDLDEFTGRNGRRAPDDGDLVPVSTRLHAQHAEPVLPVAEGHPFRKATRPDRTSDGDLSSVSIAPSPAPNRTCRAVMVPRYHARVSHRGMTAPLSQTSELNGVKARIEALAEKTVSNGGSPLTMAVGQNVRKTLNRQAWR